MSTKWQYGMRLPGSVFGGASIPSESREHCIEMLGHVMTGKFRDSGRCTCTAYRPDHVSKYIPDHQRCEPCKELLAALAELDPQAEVTFDGRTYFYSEAES